MYIFLSSIENFLLLEQRLANSRHPDTFLDATVTDTRLSHSYSNRPTRHLDLLGSYCSSHHICPPHLPHVPYPSFAQKPGRGQRARDEVASNKGTNISRVSIDTNHSDNHHGFFSMLSDASPQTWFRNLIKRAQPNPELGLSGNVKMGSSHAVES
jgi:hypothetical protein